MIVHHRSSPSKIVAYGPDYEINEALMIQYNNVMNTFLIFG